MKPRRHSAFSAKVFAAYHGGPQAEAGAAILQAHAPPAGANVARGHLARDRGSWWEAWLREQHKAAAMARLARVTHVGPPHARTGPGGENIVIVGHGPADFQGQIRGAAGAPWLPLAVEAKSLTRRMQRHDLEPHQHVDLAFVGGELARGVALVVIELHDDEGASLGRWAIPYRELETRWRVSRRERAGRVEVSRSVGPEELAGWEIDAQGIYLERFAGGGDG